MLLHNELTPTQQLIYGRFLKGNRGFSGETGLRITEAMGGVRESVDFLIHCDQDTSNPVVLAIHIEPDQGQYVISILGVHPDNSFTELTHRRPTLKQNWALTRMIDVRWECREQSLKLVVTPVPNLHLNCRDKVH